MSKWFGGKLEKILKEKRERESNDANEGGE